MQQADVILGGAPAKIVLIVGGPGSGKGLLSKRLEKECGVVHLSSGDLLRDEVRRGTPLGKEVEGIMAKGKLVSSAVLVTLMRRAMRNHPGKRVLLDGFPRSIQNAHDLMELCGVPELALHLECDDTILIERILHRASGSESRSDDNIHTALRRLRTFHKYHDSTMEWLRKQHVPVVNLVSVLGAMAFLPVHKMDTHIDVLFSGLFWNPRECVGTIECNWKIDAASNETYSFLSVRRQWVSVSVDTTNSRSEHKISNIKGRRTLCCCLIQFCTCPRMIKLDLNFVFIILVAFTTTFCSSVDP